MSRIARIKSQITGEQVEALCKAWLPAGKRKGQWWMVCSPFRDERTPSFGVKLTPSYGFYDFGTAEHGDMIDLCCRLHGVQLSDALEAFEQMLGITDG